MYLGGFFLSKRILKKMAEIWPKKIVDFVVKIHIFWKCLGQNVKFWQKNRVRLFPIFSKICKLMKIT